MPKWPLRSRKGQERQRQRNNHQTQQQTAADTTRVVVSKRPGALHKAELHLATLNVQTWHGSRYSIDDTWAPFAAATVVSAATAGVNVLAVQECRIPGSDRVSIPGPQGGDAWTLVYSGVKHHRQFINGVGFLLDAFCRVEWDPPIMRDLRKRSEFRILKRIRGGRRSRV